MYTCTLIIILGEPLTQKAQEQLERALKSHSPTKKPNITTGSSKPHPSSLSKSHPSSTSSSRLLTPTCSSKSTSSSSKSKSTSPRPLSAKPAGTHKTTKSKFSKSESHKSQTPPPRIKETAAGKKGGGSGGPVDFKELLKLAQKNNRASTGVGSSSSSDETGKQQSVGLGTGLGKALLDKQRRDKKKEEDKRVPPTKSMKSAPVVSKPGPASSSKESGATTNGKIATTKTVERVYPYELPYGGRRRLPEGVGSSVGGEGGSRGQEAAAGGIKTSRGQMNTGGRGRGGLPVSRGGPPMSRGGSSLRGSHPKSFYGPKGVPSSARLIKDGSGGRSGSSMSYKSSWVDEMRDYIHSNQFELDEYDDDDDDLDDFVVDSYEDEGEEEGAEDYSSAIQEIFGSKYRMRTAEEDDDTLMESSYAQQQFEEFRR